MTVSSLAWWGSLDWLLQPVLSRLWPDPIVLPMCGPWQPTWQLNGLAG